MNRAICPKHGPAEWRRVGFALELFCQTCDALSEANELRAIFYLPPISKLPERPVSAPEAWPAFLALDDDELQRLYDAHGLTTLAKALGVCYQRVREHLVQHGVTLRGAGNPAQAKLNAVSYDLFAEVAA